MSSDNYYVIDYDPERRLYDVYMGFASDEHVSPTEGRIQASFDHIGKAINYCGDEYSEYGFEITHKAKQAAGWEMGIKQLSNSIIVVKADSFDGVLNVLHGVSADLWSIYGDDDIPASIGKIISDLAWARGSIEGLQMMIEKFGDEG